MKSSLRILSRLFLLSLFIFLTACRGNDPQDDIAGDLDDGIFMPLDGEGGGWETTGLAERGDMGSPVDSSAYAPVYFAFDSYTVSPGEVGKIQSLAGSLTSNNAHTVILQGHTDDRGSREYNLALGERRALAVRELLLTMGISAGRIQTLSMGQESPSVAGFDESAWSLNRRVQFQLMQ